MINTTFTPEEIKYLKKLCEGEATMNVKLDSIPSNLRSSSAKVSASPAKVVMNENAGQKAKAKEAEKPMTKEMYKQVILNDIFAYFKACGVELSEKNKPTFSKAFLDGLEDMKDEIKALETSISYINTLREMLEHTPSKAKAKDNEPKEEDKTKDSKWEWTCSDTQSFDTFLNHLPSYKQRSCNEKKECARTAKERTENERLKSEKEFADFIKNFLYN